MVNKHKVVDVDRPASNGYSECNNLCSVCSLHELRSGDNFFDDFHFDAITFEKSKKEMSKFLEFYFT